MDHLERVWEKQEEYINKNVFFWIKLSALFFALSLLLRFLKIYQPL